MWIKTCGFTSAGDVEWAVARGTDAVGLVLTARSPRRVRPEEARDLARAARRAADRRGRPVEVVAVVSGEGVDLVLSWAYAVGVDAVQLHGGEGAASVAQITARGLRVILALWPQAGEPPVTASQPWAYLLDSGGASAPGGTGRTLPLALAREWAGALAAHPSPATGGGHPAQVRVVLAGGLNAVNVAAAIDTVRPWGVDVSSGIEHPGRPGQKDPRAVSTFIDAVRTWEESGHAS